jgi:hypothetical protein
MAASRHGSSIVAAAALVVAFAIPVQAQGKSDNAKNNNGKSSGSKDNGVGNEHKSTPPSASPLPSPATGPAAGASPLAWLDDASLLDPGYMSATISMMRWSGSDLSEVNFPIVEASVGLTPRFQVGANIPHIVGSADGTGPVGGVGTSYITSKIALLTGESGIKLAVSPVIEILRQGAAQSFAPGEARTQFGLPVSVELAPGQARVFASTGFFTRGVWFAGGGVGVQFAPKVAGSLSFTRSSASGGTTGISRDRRELSAGASYSVRPLLAVYGALGRTIATADSDGAGTTISGGVSVLFNARAITSGP